MNTENEYKGIRDKARNEIYIKKWPVYTEPDDLVQEAFLEALERQQRAINNGDKADPLTDDELMGSAILCFREAGRQLAIKNGCYRSQAKIAPTKGSKSCFKNKNKQIIKIETVDADMYTKDNNGRMVSYMSLLPNDPSDLNPEEMLIQNEETAFYNGLKSIFKKLKKSLNRDKGLRDIYEAILNRDQRMLTISKKMGKKHGNIDWKIRCIAKVFEQLLISYGFNDISRAHIIDCFKDMQRSKKHNDRDEPYQYRLFLPKTEVKKTGVAADIKTDKLNKGAQNGKTKRNRRNPCKHNCGNSEKNTGLLFPFPEKWNDGEIRHCQINVEHVHQ